MIKFIWNQDKIEIRSGWKDMGALTDICLSTYVGNSWYKYLGKCWAKTRIQPHVVFTKGILSVTMEPNERKVRKLFTCVWQFGFLENRKLTSNVKLWHFLAPTWGYVYWKNATTFKNLSHFVSFPSQYLSEWHLMKVKTGNELWCRLSKGNILILYPSWV